MKHGSDLVKLANKEDASVILVQETSLQDHEAATVARHLRDWHCYHQTGRFTANKATGGAAVLIHKTIPSARVTSHANGSRCSFLIRQLIAEITEPFSNLSPGDMNSTPKDDILQMWSRHHGAMILHPGTADEPESTLGIKSLH